MNNNDICLLALSRKLGLLEIPNGQVNMGRNCNLGGRNRNRMKDQTKNMNQL